MKEDIQIYHNNLSITELEICSLLYATIEDVLTEANYKIWHAHPVWFIHDNPIVGYSKQKKGIRLMFWSGKDFQENKLNVMGEKFKDASIFYNHVTEIDIHDLKCWLKKSITIQWDYKNIVKRKGRLERL
ncbi:MAG: DUF1801 domain-containing protein [Chitinophagales bacterium]|nr:DUF1801 domain-containing protein [Chitinophagales bacterium]